MRSPQFWSVIALLLASLVLVHVRGDVDRVPASVPLDQLPEIIGTYHAQDLPLNAATLEVLGKGDFLNRVYIPGDSASAPSSKRVPGMPVQLFIGYFPTQRTGQAIHSPQNCLPGSGWTFLNSGVTSFTDSTGKAYRVGDYVISDGRYKQEVLYWYQTHGNSIANDYVAKIHMLVDSIRLGRTDAALVRVLTPIGQYEPPEQAHDRVVSFAKLVTPSLPAFIPN